MGVRAKFAVESVLSRGDGYGEVILRAVTGGTDENESFWRYTPAGTITMQIDNEAALKQFKPKKEFYVDFTPANE